MKKAVSEKTEKILRKVLDYIKQEPRRLQMGVWGQILPEGTDTVEGADDANQPAPPCGTVACLAGTCLLVTKAGTDFLEQNGAVKTRGNKHYVDFPPGTPEEAMRILGISESKAKKLFYFSEWSFEGGCWPVKYSKKYMEATTPKGRYLASKARVEHFIRTGR